MQAQFTPETREEYTGGCGKGPLATLIREAIPGISGADLRRETQCVRHGGERAREPARRAAAVVYPRCWHQGPGGHVHVVSTARPGQAAAPAASQHGPGGQPEQQARQPGPGIAAALQSLARQVSGLGDNDRLREDNERLSAEVARIRALMRQIGGAIAQQASAIAQQASQLDAGPGTHAAAT